MKKLFFVALLLLSVPLFFNAGTSFADPGTETSISAAKSDETKTEPATAKKEASSKSKAKTKKGKTEKKTKSLEPASKDEKTKTFVEISTATETPKIDEKVKTEVKETATTEEKKPEPPKTGEVMPQKGAKDAKILVDDRLAPEKIVFENVGKMGQVEFNHKFHGEKNDCKACHEGDKPLFQKKISKVGYKMADIYAGKNCGFCHDGKKVVGTATVFEAKKSCTKCHKKK